MQYLQKQIEEAGDPRVKQSLTKKLLMLIYEDQTTLLNERREAFILEHGRDIKGVEELGELPSDPYQSVWILSVDGEIRSQHIDRVEAARAVSIERRFLTRPFEDWRL